MKKSEFKKTFRERAEDVRMRLKKRGRYGSWTTLKVDDKNEVAVLAVGTPTNYTDIHDKNSYTAIQDTIYYMFERYSTGDDLKLNVASDILNTDLEHRKNYGIADILEEGTGFIYYTANKGCEEGAFHRNTLYDLTFHREVYKFSERGLRHVATLSGKNLKWATGEKSFESLFREKMARENKVLKGTGSSARWEIKN